MARPDVTYTEAAAVMRQTFARGHDVSEPVAGFYRFRLGPDQPRGGVRIWFGPPHDPVTGEELDRSHRWQAEFNGEAIDFDRVWPACIGESIGEADYLHFCRRTEWAREHAPNSAYAERGRKIDPLSIDNPLPF